MYISACMYVCFITCLQFLWRPEVGIKSPGTALGLQLQTVVSYLIGAGNCSLGRTASAPTH